MGWTAYRLVYQAKSPIHIGWHTLGYIKLTRYYITGRAMWGAITANLTRSIGNHGIDGYKEIGNNVFTGYFYPALNPDLPMLPIFTDTGLAYGDYARSEFERLFIKSYGQTAITPDTNTAEDKSLHESEYISPMVNINGNQRPVYFVGYIFLNDNAEYNGKIDIERMENALSEISIGGDRKYGWGRLKLDSSARTSDMFDFKVKNTLEIEISADESIPAHLEINDSLNLKGDIEPIVGRIWGEVKDPNGEIHRGFGRKISEAKICWMPGSVLLKQETLRLDAYGILRKTRGQTNV